MAARKAVTRKISDDVTFDTANYKFTLSSVWGKDKKLRSASAVTLFTAQGRRLQSWPREALEEAAPMWPKITAQLDKMDKSAMLGAYKVSVSAPPTDGNVTDWLSQLTPEQRQELANAISE